MRESLQALLADCQGIMVVAVSGDGLSALSRIRQDRPGLLIIDSNLLEEEVVGLIAAVKIGLPDIRCLAFVQTVQQGNRLRANGADVVALRDSPLQLLQSILDRLVRMSGEP
jgi:DNA-binding NarL/FixJ family response regulator